MSLFKDPWNPTATGIRQWAYSDELAPDQDWQLALQDDHGTLLLDLADDPSCPARPFLLSSLYVLTGDAFRCRSKAAQQEIRRDVHDPGTVPHLEAMLTSAEHRGELLKAWARRSRALLAGISPYDYRFWGLGNRSAEDFGED